MLLYPWDSPGKNTGVDCYFLLQGIFPTQGSKLGPPALKADSLLSEPPGKPSIPEGILFSLQRILSGGGILTLIQAW